MRNPCKECDYYHKENNTCQSKKCCTGGDGYITWIDRLFCKPYKYEADHKTENSSEIPNNCEECKHWSDTEDGCADRHGCRTTTEDSLTVPTCSVNGRPYKDCCNCEYFKCTADEPQTSWYKIHDPHRDWFETEPQTERSSE